jgi:hypothetical protein
MDLEFAGTLVVWRASMALEASLCKVLGSEMLPDSTK